MSLLKLLVLVFARSLDDVDDLSLCVHKLLLVTLPHIDWKQDRGWVGTFVAITADGLELLGILADRSNLISC